MKMRNTYLVLFLLGSIIPYYSFIMFISEAGFDLNLAIHRLFANHISSFFAWDVILSAIVLILFILSDLTRERIKYLWAPIAATLLIGVSSGLPLFLYLREGYLEDNEK